MTAIQRNYEPAQILDGVDSLRHDVMRQALTLTCCCRSLLLSLDGDKSLHKA